MSRWFAAAAHEMPFFFFIADESSINIAHVDRHLKPPSVLSPKILDWWTTNYLRYLTLRLINLMQLS